MTKQRIPRPDKPMDPHRQKRKTLAEDIAALADDEAVMWAVGVLTDKGINGAMFEKLMTYTSPHTNGTA